MLLKGAGPLLYLSTPLELVEMKADSSGAMEFSAYASTFANVDHGGDIIEKGAFTKTLRDRNRDRPLLWQHDMRSPIGVEKSLNEDDKGLIGTWEIIDTAQGLDAYKLLKRGAIRSMSIGYIPKTWEWQNEGDNRLLKEIDLLENSVVSIPMNDQARVQSVKTLSDQESLDTIIQAVVKAVREPRPAPAPTSKEAPAAAPGYSELTLVELANVVRDVVAAFGERTRDLLDKLSVGDFDLTEAKRTDLQALLETFSGIDAVRHDAEAVLAHKQQLPDPTPSQLSATALAIELCRHRLRARGVEI